jgi:hypothetical protein
MGALEVDAATAAVQPLDGPSLIYNGIGQPDLRSAPFAKDGFRPGQQPAFLQGANLTILDAIPQARSSTTLAASQVVTSAVTVALVTAQPTGVASAAGIAIGVPIIPIGTTVVTYANIAIDFGFTTGTTVAGSTTVTVVDNTLFNVGQWIVIGGVGNTSASRSLIAQVASIVTGGQTAITIAPAAVTAISHAPIGHANLWGSGFLPNATQFGPSAPAATAHAFGGAMTAGLARVYNPREMSSRNVTFFSNGTTAYSAVVSGWDVWGNPMTEVIAASATTFQGRKAFKYISAITSGTTPGLTGAFGIGDVIGLPLRVDYWEEIRASWNGVAMANFSGLVGGLAGTSVANATTDVRGTLQLSTAVVTNGLATAMSIVASNGTGRIYVEWNRTPQIAIQGTPVNQLPIFGQSQYTATS